MSGSTQPRARTSSSSSTPDIAGNMRSVTTHAAPSRRPSARKASADAYEEQQNPAALAGYHKAEIDKWWPIIKAANIKVEAH